MTDTEKKGTGRFLLSLDTELSWGYYDLDGARRKKFSPDGSRERRSILRILEMLDLFGIPATWAVVGHLFYSHCEECAICPVRGWRGKFQSYHEIFGTDDRRWYGADIIPQLVSRPTRHEIAFHGYTHTPFDDAEMTLEDAEQDVQEWNRIAQRWGIRPLSAVFPRNRARYLALFRQHGFICFRGEELPPNGKGPHLLRKALNRLDHIFQWRVPQSYDALVDPSGLINLPASRWIFHTGRNALILMDVLRLRGWHRKRLLEGIRRAAEDGKIIHLWAHPCEIQTESDWETFTQVLACAALEIRRGRLAPATMAGLAEQFANRPPEEKGRYPRNAEEDRLPVATVSPL